MIKSLDYVAAVLLIILFVITAVALITPLKGWQSNTVMSGSMEPAISAGDLIVTAPVAANDVYTGDIITFVSLNGLTCHRVTGITQSPLTYITKGDANAVTDSQKVMPDRVIGKVVLRVPMLGYASYYVRTPAGLIFTVVIPGLLIVGLEMKRMLWERS